MYLARKVTLRKWDASQDLAEGEISADAITADLRTRDNALSLWQCESPSQEESEDAVLALAASGDRIDKMDLVWLTSDVLQADSQQYDQTDGGTQVADLAERHFDVKRLDYVRLGKIAGRVVEAIEQDQYCRFNKSSVKNLLLSAVRKNRVGLDSLKDKVKKELEEALGQETEIQ